MSTTFVTTAIGTDARCRSNVGDRMAGLYIDDDLLLWFGRIDDRDDQVAAIAALILGLQKLQAEIVLRKVEAAA